LWFVADEVGSITRPIKELVYFEKKNIQPNETVTYQFELHPERDLSFPDKLGQTVLEDGSFLLQVGNQEQRFWLNRNKLIKEEKE